LIIFLSRRDTIEIKSNDFVKVLAIVVLIASVMVSVAYGIQYIIDTNQIPVPLHYIVFIFAIGFVVFSVYFEKERGAIYPWSLLGGAIVSAIFSFIVMAAIGGILYIISVRSLIDIGTDSWFYALSTCIILSMILYNLAKNKL
jgi:RsiW-degrading membrane proteinase PrsW (M82 family)